jgi:hypothetical protein
MGVHKHGGTMPGAVTPICESAKTCTSREPQDGEA